ncbi:hypothetical protein [Streptomyces sp. AK02-01A]|uniref:hypothetical protein n=1 Tax=Streptomyces sp. AK02-01A TaxID=3028648 RepID=UPI0029B92E1D|nr:hypothetical protein [Streptomyces sp. AK02-01A]MDX3853376.1 hypothetical protein [Streptomyces sp. AK02-01A]
MDEERAGRLVSSLRARGVMAHLAHLGVYEFGVQIVLADGGEAVWDIDEAVGLRAEVVEDGVLMGYVPHVPGSENFTEEQLMAVIAATTYDKEGLHPPTDGPARSGEDTARPPESAAGPVGAPRRAHHRGRGFPWLPRRPDQ